MGRILRWGLLQLCQSLVNGRVGNTGVIYNKEIRTIIEERI